MQVTEQRVFQPERKKEDSSSNTCPCPPIRAHYWRFRPIQARTSDEQATSLISTMSWSGALTANVIRTIGALLLGAEGF